MAVTEGRTWLEYLSQPLCWDLLEQAEVGRIGVVVDSAPESYPLNFVVHDHTIVFRTDAGPIRSAAAASTHLSRPPDVRHGS